MATLTIPQGSPMLNNYQSAPTASSSTTPNSSGASAFTSSNAASPQPALGGRVATPAEAEKLASPTVFSDSTIRDSKIPEITQTAGQLTGTTGGAPSNVYNGIAYASPIEADTKRRNDEALKAGIERGNADAANTAPNSYEDVFNQTLDKQNAQPNDPITGSIMKNISDVRAKSDASTAAQLASVEAGYNARREMLMRANQSTTAELHGLLMSSGAYRTGSGIAAQTAKEQSDMFTLNTLSDQEQAAKADIYKAQSDMDFQLMDRANQTLKDLQDKKFALAQKIADQVQATNKALLDRANKVQDDMNSVASDAAKNGAPSEIIDAIHNAKDVSSAIAAAGNYLQSGTGTLGDYLQYKRETEAKGLVPKDYQTYLNDKNAQDLKNKTAEAYATQSAKNQADANSTASDKTQQKLEQQYRQVLSKEFSSRTGALGIENQKVNQANHLDSLFKQYYDPKTGNYNIPKAQYGEVVLGLANLISPSGVASDSLRAEITQRTLKGDIAGALSYITGEPMTGSTQDVFKNLVDSIDRQAETAINNREAALQNLRDQAPTDLDQSRVDALNKSTKMVTYTGQDRIDKSTVDRYVQENPSDAESIAKMYEIPGATDSAIKAWLQANGKI